MTSLNGKRPWHQEGEDFVYIPPDQEEWDRLREHLYLGQILTGTVVWVPYPGAIGVGIDLNMPVGGFIDVLLLPRDANRWPTVGSVGNFEIWWMNEYPQIRLIATDQFLMREDFNSWVREQDSGAPLEFRRRHEL